MEINQQSFKEIYDEANCGIAIYEVLNDGKYGKDYIIKRFNKAGLEIENKTLSQVVGKKLIELRPTIDDSGLINIFRKAWKTGIPQKFPSMHYVDETYNNYYENYVFKLEDGSVVALYNDVSNIMNLLKKAEDNEEKIRAILDQSPLGIAIVNSITNKYIEINQSLSSITHRSIDELMLEDWISITHPDDLQEDLDYMKLLNQGEINNYKREKRYLLPEGGFIWATLIVARINYKHSNEKIHLCMIEDITQQKRAERNQKSLDGIYREQQRLESISTLAAGVAHEINNPLNGVINYSQLIVDECKKDSAIQGYANEIMRESHRISIIVKNLLQFSRRESPEYEVNKIDKILDSTLSLINVILKRNQIELIISLDSNLPLIYCHSQQIQQVLMNLIINARDSLNEKYPSAHKNKEINLTINLIEKDNNRYLRISVTDQGMGIPKKIRQRIYEPFFSTKPKEIGTGLGLSISYGIIKEHKGFLSFDTEVGKYTTFYLDLPVYKESDLE